MFSVEGILQLRKPLQEQVEQWSKPLEQLQSEGIADPEMTQAQRLSRVDSASEAVRSTQSMLDTRQRDLNRAWSAYQSKLRLLGLDLEEAKLAFETLTGEHNRARQHPDKGAFSISEVQATESRLAVAGINVQRAEEMLKLYADIEIQEPQLNPDSPKNEK